jgi:hypothetical protein
MSANVRILFAGILTIFGLLAVGFDSILAQSPLKKPSGYQSPISSPQPTSVRIILRASADAAQPSQSSLTANPSPKSQSEAQAANGGNASFATPVETIDIRKSRCAEERHERQVERKQLMVARARQQMEQMRQRPGPSVLAYGGDEPRKGDFFGN